MEKYLIYGLIAVCVVFGLWVAFLVADRRKYKNKAIASKVEADAARKETEFLKDLEKGGKQNATERLNGIDDLVNDLDPRTSRADPKT